MKKTIKIFACVAMVVTLLLTLAVPCFADYEESYPVEFSLESYSQASIEQFIDKGSSVTLEGVYPGGDSAKSVYGYQEEQNSSEVTITIADENQGVLSASFDIIYVYVDRGSSDEFKDGDLVSCNYSFYFGTNGQKYVYTNGAYVSEDGSSVSFRCDTSETAESLRELLCFNPASDTTESETTESDTNRMSDLVIGIFDSFSIVIGGLTEGLKDSFDELIYVDPAAEDLQFSPLILFLFTLAGVAVATGIVYSIFSLVKRNRRG